MLWIIILIASFLITLLAIWLTATRRRLAAMDENVRNAMGQLGLLISSRFDALISLIGVTRAYAARETEVLLEDVNSHRRDVTARSTPADARKQETILSDALLHIQRLSEQYPDMKENMEYQRHLDAVESFGKMADTGRLIYNDSAARLNGAMKPFPVSLMARPLGFYQRDYLEPAGAITL